MSRNFFLNLAKRSASKTTVPQARPYMHPVFMPPVPTSAFAAISPAPPGPQDQTQTATEKASSHPHAFYRQPIAEPDSPRHGKHAKFPPPTSPSPLVSPLKMTRPVDIEQSAFASADSSPDPQDGAARSGRKRVDSLLSQKTDIMDGPPRSRRKRVDSPQLQKFDTTFHAPQPHSKDSGEPATSLQASPPAYFEPVPEMRDKFNAKIGPQSSLSPSEEKSSAIKPLMPEPFVATMQDPPLSFSVIERVVKPESSPKKQPQIPRAEMSAPPTTPSPASAPSHAVEKNMRETLAGAYPDISRMSNDRNFRDRHSTESQTLKPTKTIEPSTTTETPLPRRVRPESPASTRVEHVTPAPKQGSPLQPPRVHSSSPAPIQVSIGTVDLRVNPRETSKMQAPYRRKRPQGFDGFRQRRSYSGWEY